MNRSLIAYYSRIGNNYVNGKIINLPIGNTAIIADKIQKLTDADMFEIDTIKPYPADYIETTEVSKIELKNNARPKLSNNLKDISEYSTIYLGYPNWWGTMPMPVFTFLESHNFSGKTIIPFCTHEGSGLGKSEKDIKKCCPNTNILSGLAIQGSQVAGAYKEVFHWLKVLNQI